MRKTLLAILVVASLGITLAGCSSGGTGASTSPAAGDAALVAKAKARIQPLEQKPTAFPVTEPLAKLPKGSKIAIIDCGSTICGLFADLAKTPAEKLGMTTTRIESGTTADGVASAFDTVLAGNYDGVFVLALDPALWSKYLTKLNAAHIPVVTSGIIGVDPSKVVAAGAGDALSTSSGGIMADWTIARNGSTANVVFYNTPELSFSEKISSGFTAEMKALCPKCTVRVVDIPLAQYGSGAPQIVVDDLTAHPATKTAVFATGEQTVGLPAALKVAGISVQTMLNSPDPSVLKGIQDGTFTAGIGVDLPVLVWSMIDALARSITGQQVEKAVKDGDAPRQILTAANLTGDVANGWSGYPDFADRFQKLWADAK